MDTFWIIPHTHWEGAVFQGREAYLRLGLPHIVSALRLLDAHPEYRFTLDQVCYIRPFIERYPELAELFRRFVDEGRLEIVGGTDVMADVNMPGGENFIRQLLYGKRYLRETLGVDVTVGWQLDTFGHHAQMPQIMRRAGYESYWFFRGVANWDVPSEFLWEGLDGSRIRAVWLPHGYANFYGSPSESEQFPEFAEERYRALDGQTAEEDRAGLAGADVVEPETHLPTMIEEYNRSAEGSVQLRLAVPTEFEGAVSERFEDTVIRGDMNPIFQGTYSSRIELKQRTQRLEYLLAAAEQLTAASGWLGSATDDADLWRAWEPVLFNQAHDLAAGVMTDAVYRDVLDRYAFSAKLADDSLERGIEAVSARIDTEGEGTPAIVWNTLGWQRSDIVEVDVGFGRGAACGVKVTGPDGAPQPLQIVSERRAEDGSLEWARIAFIAEVPAVGYSVYFVAPDEAEVAACEAQAAAPVVELENERCELTLDGVTGAIGSLCVKEDGWEALSGNGNVIARQRDEGDLWELYENLDGGSRIARTEEQPAPERGEAWFSDELTGDAGTVTVGPVFSEFAVEQAFGEQGRFGTSVRVYSGLPRIDITTDLRNDERFVRYQALFSTSIEDGRNVQAIPFGAVERPEGVEYPAQGWVDYGDDERGIALLNRGLPGNLVSGGTMMLSLLRATCIRAYGFSGGYEPGMSSDTGFELDAERSFQYAVVPHSGSWSEAGIFRRAMEFNHPLIAHKMRRHAGELPKRHGWLEVSHDNVVVSAVKPGPDGTIVIRLYEAAGADTADVAIRFAGGVASVCETDLMERETGAADLDENTLHLDIGAFEIRTFAIEPDGPGPGSG